MSFLSLDLNLLRIFDAVMTEQNLTRAAGHLAMTQPAVSNALKRLREALGDDLLIRTAFGVKPTPRAEALWPTIRHALSELETALEPDTFEVTKASTTFRLSMADSSAGLWMPLLAAAIEHEAPLVQIHMVPLTTREPRPMLLRGDIDLAFGYFPGVTAQLAGQGGMATPIHHERLYSGHYVCVMRHEHPMAASELTLDSYCAARHLQVSLSGRAYGVIDETLAQMNRERRIVMMVNQFFTAGRVVANSDLITVLPRHLIASSGMSNVLISKEVPFALPEVHVDMLWHERDARSPSHKWLRQRLTAITGDTFGHGKV